MQETVSSFSKDMRFKGYLLVRMSEMRTSNATGKQYLDITLADRSGEINCKYWNNDKQPRVGTVIWLQGLVQEYNGRLQLRIESLRGLNKDDAPDMDLLVKCAPEKPEKMLSEIGAAIEEMTWEDLKAVMRVMIARAGDKLLYYPAAQRLHHAERGGLLHHTLSMLRVARAVAPLYPFLNRDLLFAGVIAHDLGKIDEMQSDDLGNVGDYTAEGLLLGHLVGGVANVRECAAEAGVGGEAVLLLSHMIISHHGVPEFGSPRAPMFPEAEALHMIDDLDAKLNEMEGVMERIPEGVFSEKIWSLDRRLYHPRYPAEKEEEPDAGEGRGSYDGLL